MPHTATKEITSPLRVKALCDESLVTLAALVQDAMVPKASLAYNPEEKRFMLHLSRFMWEDRALQETSAEVPESRGTRVEAMLTIDHVHHVEHKDLPRAISPEEKGNIQVLDLCLLTVDRPSDNHVRLIFSGGSELLLHTHAMEIHLADTPHTWVTACRPDHGVGL